MKSYAPLIIVLMLVSASFVGVSYKVEKSFESYDGKTLYVGGSGEGNYSKIQDAIDDASDGDTVFVYNDSSPYEESILVNKSINLIGEDRDTTKIINIWDYLYVINIAANKVNISGFTIILNFGFDYYNIGCISIDSSNNNISNNIIKSNWGEYEAGINLLCSSNNNTIIGNIISNNNYGIYFDTSSDNVIMNNNFSNNFLSIKAQSSSYNTIKENNFNKNNHDISIEDYCLNNIITENTFSNTKCCVSIFLSNSNNNTVSNNIIRSLPEGIGIFLWDSNDNIIFGNTIGNLTWEGGIKLFSSSNNNISSNTLIFCNGISFYYLYSRNYCISCRHFTWSNFKSNTIQENHYGIIHFDYGDNNTIYHNNFINNKQYAYDECNNIWDDGYPSGGNFWDNYNGTDDDGDGIGDTPYLIPGGDNEDRYPLMEPYGNWTFPPFAKFTWTPSHPDPGETIIFNASESIDYDGNISLYEWDWDNDGEYETLKTTPTATHSWSNDGYYPVNMRVTDNDNLTDSKTKTVRVGNYPPYKPSNPIPPDGATNILPGCLEWTGGDPDGDTVVYDVYLGTKSPPPLLACNISQTISCSPGDLLFNKTYYWQIVAWDEHGAFTEGPIWSFTIRDNNPPDNPIMEGQKIFEIGQGGESTYTFYSIDPEGDNIIYEIKWGDGIIDYLGPYESGLKVSIDRSIPFVRGTYILFKIRARDFFGEKSNWTTLTVYVVEVKTTFLLGFIENKEQEDNFSIVTVKFLLTARFIPFDVRFLSPGKNIVISNEYIGFVGSCYMVGRFKTDFD